MSSSRADSIVAHATANTRARISSSRRVVVSITDTARARPSLSVRISRATRLGSRVKLPVRCALGSIELGTVKIAPASQPSMQWPQ